jgi:hypothetical protein
LENEWYEEQVLRVSERSALNLAASDKWNTAIRRMETVNQKARRGCGYVAHRSLQHYGGDVSSIIRASNT